jgi:hypothetical protein
MDGPMLWPRSHSSVDELIKVVVVREDDVTTHVEEEAFWCDVGAGKASGFRSTLNEEPILMLELVETSCSSKT